MPTKIYVLFVKSSVRYCLTFCLMASISDLLAHYGQTIWSIWNSFNNFCPSWSENDVCQIWSWLYIICRRNSKNPRWSTKSTLWLQMLVCVHFSIFQGILGKKNCEYSTNYSNNIQKIMKVVTVDHKVAQLWNVLGTFMSWS